MIIIYIFENIKIIKTSFIVKKCSKFIEKGPLALTTIFLYEKTIFAFQNTHTLIRIFF